MEIVAPKLFLLAVVPPGMATITFELLQKSENKLRIHSTFGTFKRCVYNWRKTTQWCSPQIQKFVWCERVRFVRCDTYCTYDPNEVVREFNEGYPEMIGTFKWFADTHSMCACVCVYALARIKPMRSDSINRFELCRARLTSHSHIVIELRNVNFIKSAKSLTARFCVMNSISHSCCVHDSLERSALKATHNTQTCGFYVCACVCTKWYCACRRVIGAAATASRIARWFYDRQ